MGNYKIFFFFFVLAIFLFLPEVILASPTLDITKVPNSITVEESFSVEVAFVGLEPKEKYFIKAVGGENWYDVKTWSDKTGKWLAWNGAWAEMPETIASDDSTSISTISAKFVDKTTLGENQFKIKIVKWDKTSNPFYSKDVVIDILPAPTPTPTPEVTEEPEETPTPTSTPTPTIKFIPTPTKKPTPTLKPSPTSTPAGEILGEEESATNAFYPLEATEEAESTSQSGSSFKTRWLPKILLGVGFLLLFGAAFWVWYTKLRWPEQESS